MESEEENGKSPQYLEAGWFYDKNKKELFQASSKVDFPSINSTVIVQTNYCNHKQMTSLISSIENKDKRSNYLWQEDFEKSPEKHCFLLTVNGTYTNQLKSNYALPECIVTEVTYSRHISVFIRSTNENSMMKCYKHIKECADSLDEATCNSCNNCFVYEGQLKDFKTKKTFNSLMQCMKEVSPIVREMKNYENFKVTDFKTISNNMEVTINLTEILSKTNKASESLEHSDIDEKVENDSSYSSMKSKGNYYEENYDVHSSKKTKLNHGSASGKNSDLNIANKIENDSLKKVILSTHSKEDLEENRTEERTGSFTNDNHNKNKSLSDSSNDTHDSVTQSHNFSSEKIFATKLASQNNAILFETYTNSNCNGKCLGNICSDCAINKTANQCLPKSKPVNSSLDNQNVTDYLDHSADSRNKGELKSESLPKIFKIKDRNDANGNFEFPKDTNKLVMVIETDDEFTSKHNVSSSLSVKPNIYLKSSKDVNGSIGMTEPYEEATSKQVNSFKTDNKLQHNKEQTDDANIKPSTYSPEKAISLNDVSSLINEELMCKFDKGSSSSDKKPKSEVKFTKDLNRSVRNVETCNEVTYNNVGSSSKDDKLKLNKELTDDVNINQFTNSSENATSKNDISLSKNEKSNHKLFSSENDDYRSKTMNETDDEPTSKHDSISSSDFKPKSDVISSEDLNRSVSMTDLPYEVVSKHNSISSSDFKPKSDMISSEDLNRSVSMTDLSYEVVSKHESISSSDFKPKSDVISSEDLNRSVSMTDLSYELVSKHDSISSSDFKPKSDVISSEDLNRSLSMTDLSYEVVSKHDSISSSDYKPKTDGIYSDDQNRLVCMTDPSYEVVSKHDGSSSSDFKPKSDVISSEDLNISVCMNDPSYEVVSKHDSISSSYFKPKSDGISSEYQNRSVCVKDPSYEIVSKHDSSFSSDFKPKSDLISSEDLNRSICMADPSYEVVSKHDSSSSSDFKPKSDTISSEDLNTSVCMIDLSYEVVSKHDSSSTSDFKPKSDVMSSEDLNRSVCMTEPSHVVASKHVSSSSKDDKLKSNVETTDDMNTMQATNSLPNAILKNDISSSKNEKSNRKTYSSENDNRSKIMNATANEPASKRDGSSSSDMNPKSDVTPSEVLNRSVCMTETSDEIVSKHVNSSSKDDQLKANKETTDDVKMMQSTNSSQNATFKNDISSSKNEKPNRKTYSSENDNRSKVMDETDNEPASKHEGNSYLDVRPKSDVITSKDLNRSVRDIEPCVAVTTKQASNSIKNDKLNFNKDPSNESCKKSTYISSKSHISESSSKSQTLQNKDNVQNVGLLNHTSCKSGDAAEVIGTIDEYICVNDVLEKYSSKLQKKETVLDNKGNSFSLVESELNGIRKVEIGKKRCQQKERTLLLLGPTGSGKTTLINLCANFYFGAQFAEDKKLFIVDSKRKTDRVTVYTFYSDEEDKFPLTVIDTPGLNDSTGSEIHDHVDMLKSFLAVACSNGLKIHALGFVAQAHLVRLTSSEKLVMDYTKSLFGVEVENHIMALVTFSDNQPTPPVIEAMEQYGFKTPRFVKFNNTLLISDAEEVDELDKIYWRTGIRSWRKCLKHLNNMNPLPNASVTAVQNDVFNRSFLNTRIELLKSEIVDLVSLIVTKKHFEEVFGDKKLQDKRAKVWKAANIAFNLETCKGKNK